MKIFSFRFLMISLIKSFILVCFMLLQLCSKSQCVANDHFWCPWEEAQQFRANDSVCYHPEGFAFSLWKERDFRGGHINGVIPLYRFYNPKSGFHFYSTSKEEGINGGYSLEGIFGYSGANAQTYECIPIYRFYNPTNGNHFYTADKNGESIIKNGYVAEGVGFYGWDLKHANMRIVRFYSPSSQKTKKTFQDYKIWDELDNYYNPQQKISKDFSNEELLMNKRYNSPNKKYLVIFQSDGNLVVYKDSPPVPLWSSQTNGKRVTKCMMQSDGNLVLYDGKSPIWNSQTCCYADTTKSRLIMQDDGNLVIVACIKCYWTPLWSSQTGKWTKEQIDNFPGTHPNGAKCCTTKPPPRQCQGNGIVNFYNTYTQSLWLYYWYAEDVANGSEECKVRKLWRQLASGNNSFQIPKNKTLIYRIYTRNVGNDDCSSAYLRQYGSAYSCQWNNGVINVN